MMLKIVVVMGKIRTKTITRHKVIANNKLNINQLKS